MAYFVEMFFTFFIIVLPSLYYYYTKIYKIEKFLKKLPGPPKVPFYGNSLQFASQETVFENLDKCLEKYGSKVHLKFGPGGNYMLCSDRKFLEFLLDNNKLSKNDAEFFVPMLGRGLGMLNGPKWKIHRKLLNPTFHVKILEQFIEIFDQAGGVLVEKLEAESGNACVDIYPYITKCTFDTICETAMGVKPDSFNNDHSAYFDAIGNMRQINLIRTMTPLKRYDWFYWLSKEYKIAKESSRIMREYTLDVVTKKRKELMKKQKVEDEVVDDVGIKKRKVFLDLILEATPDDEYLSEEDVLAEVTTFLFGGHDTGASAISFALYCLANNKEAQEKVLEEQKELFGDDKNPNVTFKHLQEMKYLENVLKESMRLYSPAPLYPKIIDEDIVYEGTVIPKGLKVLLYIYRIHRDPKLWPNPETFDPSRFENVKLPPFTFSPFGEGPRLCIGHRFAMVEAKTLVAKVVRNFELFPAVPKHEVQLVPELILKSANGVKIGLKQRL